MFVTRSSYHTVASKHVMTFVNHNLRELTSAYTCLHIIVRIAENNRVKKNTTYI